MLHVYSPFLSSRKTDILQSHRDLPVSNLTLLKRACFCCFIIRSFLLDDQMCSPLAVGVIPLVLLLLGPNRYGHMLCQSSNEVMRDFPVLWRSLLLIPDFLLCFCCIGWSNDWTDACKLVVSYCRCWLVCGCMYQWGLQRGGTPDRQAPTIPPAPVLLFFFLFFFLHYFIRIATKHFGVWLLNL